jgi:glycosyltransferase involved in cell wall biosynthesis
MAGTINGIGSNRKLLSELANPLSSYRYYKDFRYYSDKILPYTLEHEKITYSGNLSFARKMKFLSESRALLFPIDWEEPFGMVVIEALACGTPVVAMKRGAMPEIIEHGVNGFLANNEKEFEEYVDRVGEIDPAACRKSVEDNFSADCMAAAYLERYKQAIRLNGKKV